MLDSSFFMTLMWFLCGALTHKIGALLLGYGKIGIVANDVIFQSLRLLIMVTEDVAFMRQMKYLQMQKSDVDDETIKLAKEMDKQTIDTWKSIVIHRFATIYPRQMQSLVRFETWEEALTILTKEITKRKL